jgi:transposase
MDDEWMRTAPKVELSMEDRDWLEKVSRSRIEAVRLSERALIVLMAADGRTNREIGLSLGLTEAKAARWRGRFIAQGRNGIEQDAPGRGRKPTYPPEMVAMVVRRTTRQKPEAATHWSRRVMARATDLSPSTIGRIWQRHGLKPHLSRTFKVSNDPHFAEKLEDIVGLYLDAPEHALVFCCDEKSQVQALDRTQPGLPMKKGRASTFTHDYVRHGTTTLFAALNVADGTVIGQCQARHRHIEWLKFLRLLEEQTPAHRDLHLILDNYATHKHPKVKAWLEKHPRFHLHFTPTSASWLNMVERFFRDLTTQRLRRGVFRSLPELIEAITGYLRSYNARPTPFVWTATANDILAKVKRARRKLHTLR